MMISPVFIAVTQIDVRTHNILRRRGIYPRMYPGNSFHNTLLKLCEIKCFSNVRL